MIPTRIGPYIVRGRLGSGGIGDVYRAVDPALDREVAIKVLRPGLAAQAEIIARFRSEARTLAQLNHPNIATLYSLHEDGDALAMVMEYVDGQTFSNLITRRGPMPVPEALAIFAQALEGVGFAHAHGVIHRDLKSANLMVDRSGAVKVMDFGIARCIGSDRTTRVGLVVGTAQYMAPEQVCGKPADVRSDIYSLGVVLYELLCARLPFEGESEYEMMRAQIEQAPTRISRWVSDVSEEVQQIVLRALHKDPAQRFRSTDALLEALQPFIPVQRPTPSRRSASALTVETASPLPAPACAAPSASAQARPELPATWSGSFSRHGAPALDPDAPAGSTRRSTVIWELPGAHGSGSAPATSLRSSGRTPPDLRPPPTGTRQQRRDSAVLAAQGRLLRQLRHAAKGVAVLGLLVVTGSPGAVRKHAIPAPAEEPARSALAIPALIVPPAYIDVEILRESLEALPALGQEPTPAPAPQTAQPAAEPPRPAKPARRAAHRPSAPAKAQKPEPVADDTPAQTDSGGGWVIRRN